MTSLSGKYVIDEKGERVGVLLSIDEYERFLAELEELESIRAKASKDEAIPSIRPRVRLKKRDLLIK